MKNQVKKHVIARRYDEAIPEFGALKYGIAALRSQ
jgi:hypothetical protein